MRSIRRAGWQGVALAGLLALGLAVAAGCGGDDDDDAGADETANGAPSTATSDETPAEATAGAPADDPEADADAHAALIGPEDLPGENWVVVAEDEFDDDLSLGDENSEACRALSEATDSGQEELDAARLGRAQRSLSLSDPEQFVPLSIEVEINVFENEDLPAERFDLFREVLSGDDFVDCLEQATVQSLGDTEGEISVERVDPQVDAPSDGEGFAAVVNARLQSEEGETAEFSLHVEGYVWRYQNAGVTVFISGAEEAINEEVVSAAVNTVHERLEEAFAN